MTYILNPFFLNSQLTCYLTGGKVKICKLLRRVHGEVRKFTEEKVRPLHVSWGKVVTVGRANEFLSR